MAAVVGLSLFRASPAVASTPDTQEVYPPAGSLAMLGMAQTFTPTHTGQLYQVSLFSGTAGYLPATFYINIWGATAGKPSAPCALDPTNPLTTKENVFLGTNWMNDFPLAHSVPVTANTQYAIVVCSPIANVFRWSYENGETYSGGGAFLWAGSWWPGGPFVKAFDFQAWVSTNVNQAPALMADRGSVKVPEGTAPANTGTYSDSDGDTVTISASSGSVTKTGTSSGTWQWSAAASDETSTQTVVIKADDGQGNTNTTSFTVDVTKVAPRATILSDPLSVPEGTPVPFTGVATTPFGPDSASLVLGWTVTNNGNVYASGSGTAFSFTPADDGTYDVTFSATDDSGMTGTSSTTVTATNVAPIASITGVIGSAPLVTATEETLTFSGTFTDADSADAYTITWNFGDGTPPAAGRTVTHAYAAAQSYTVTFQVSDGEGGVSTATTTVNVQTTQQALTSIAAFVQNLPGLNAGQKNSLLAKLNAASDAAGRGDTTAAHNQLNAFLNELQADVNTGKVSSADAGTLRSAVHAVQGALGTYNRFLEWWPLEA